MKTKWESGKTKMAHIARNHPADTSSLLLSRGLRALTLRQAETGKPKKTAKPEKELKGSILSISSHKDLGLITL